MAGVVDRHRAVTELADRLDAIDRRLGAAGGRVCSPAKADSARKNGRKGGRPKRQAG